MLFPETSKGSIGLFPVFAEGEQAEKQNCGGPEEEGAADRKYCVPEKAFRNNVD